MKKVVGTMAVVCAAVFTLACNTENRNETTTNNDSTIGTTGVSDGDREFVEASASANSAEVELGKLAEQRATSNEVKKFAAMMVSDHSKANQELMQVAQQHSIQAPSDLNEEHRDLVGRLSNLRGADFDREYMEAMIDSHQDVIDHLQTRASEDRIGDNKGAVEPEGSDNPVEASLNQWAAATLPAARHHLEEAQRINEGLGRSQTQR